MRLSIITINYNDANGLRNTFESIKRQTCKDFEYIVVDGNSNDASLSVIKEYEDCISKWISEPDTGIYNAMNKGARMSSGDYMLFLNSGDFLYSDNAIQSVLAETFDEDIICCSLYSFNKKTGIYNLPPRNVSLYTFIGGGSMLHPSTLIGRSIFNKIGGYIEKYRIISDWCFFIDAMIVQNCSYKVFEKIVLTSFNCYGISSLSNVQQSRIDAQKDFLCTRFPRIIDDYLQLNDEPLANTVIYISNLTGVKKKILSFPAKFLNSALKLRFVLNKRTLLKIHK